MTNAARHRRQKEFNPRRVAGRAARRCCPRVAYVEACLPAEPIACRRQRRDGGDTRFAKIDLQSATPCVRRPAVGYGDTRCQRSSRVMKVTDHTRESALRRAPRRTARVSPAIRRQQLLEPSPAGAPMTCRCSRPPRRSPTTRAVQHCLPAGGHSEEARHRR